MRVLQTIRCMGIRWTLFRLLYAMKRRLGYFRYRLPQGEWPPVEGLQLRVPTFSGPGSLAAVREADELLAGTFVFFSRHKAEMGCPPDWFCNPFSGNQSRSAGPEHRAVHWSQVSDTTGGDIKGVWELSRFGFVYILARAYHYSGEEKYAEAFWELLEDWRIRNPPNTGVHWRCGQEVAIRIMAWCFAAGAFRHSPATTAERVAMLAQMIAVSAQRIEGNLSYALSQKNNHGISEAMGLWSAGIVLADHPRARHWEAVGRSLLERLGLELIYEDGTFSQYSVNYHRLMLHDYLWAIQLGVASGRSFSDPLLDRIRLAAEFLTAMVDPATGEVPNVGANDGALLIRLTDCDYTDHRPTAQAFARLASGSACFPPGPWDEMTEWLGLERNNQQGEQRTTCGEQRSRRADQEDPGNSSAMQFKEGGFFILRSESTRGVIRCTGRYRHRPSHADQLHLDLWYRGTNVLRDAGSFSYNCQEPWQSYFRGTAAHNTIQFDGRDQMPAISRFLFGRWLEVTHQCIEREHRCVSWSGQYEDYRHCFHRRQVCLDRSTDTWTVVDRVEGYRARAVLRWRLAPAAEWHLDGWTCRSELCSVSVSVDVSNAEVRLAEGWESRYYLERTGLPVLEVSLPPSEATVTSVLRFGRALQGQG